jgi:hypothetical protein
MKRCPECDFIYEDDDRQCAMDGTGLVNFTGRLPFEESSLPQSVGMNSSGRGLTLIAASVMLAIAVSLYFQSVAKQRTFESDLHGAAGNYYKARSDDHDSSGLPPVMVTPFFAPPPIEPTFSRMDLRWKIYRSQEWEDKSPIWPIRVTTAPLSKPSASFGQIRPPSANSVLTKKPTVTNSEMRVQVPLARQTKTADSNQKKEPRITSFLKKARRVLKKPF